MERRCSKCCIEKDASMFNGGRSSCKACAIVQLRAWEKEYPVLFRYGQSKRIARRKGKTFSISFEEYRENVEKPCFYCDGFFGKVTRDIGLDRVDNALGYVPGNVVSCCQFCNKLKSSVYTLEETKEMIGALIRVRQLRTRKVA